VAQDACDQLVEIDEEDGYLREQFPDVKFEKDKKADFGKKKRQ
jgi:hypothetical protein